MRRQARAYRAAGDSDSALSYRRAAARVEEIIVKTVEGAAQQATAGGMPQELGALAGRAGGGGGGGGMPPGVRPEGGGTQVGGALGGNLAAAGAPAGGQ